MRDRKRIILAMIAAGCIFAGGCGIKESPAEGSTAAEAAADELPEIDPEAWEI